jgi:hypothetical protein
VPENFANSKGFSVTPVLPNNTLTLHVPGTSFMDIDWEFFVWCFFWLIIFGVVLKKMRDFYKNFEIYLTFI